MPDYDTRDQSQQVNVGGDNTGAITVTAVHQHLPPRPTVAAALRRDLATFIGRDRELERILTAAAPGRVWSIYTIDGMAGVGKTALATRAAHELKAGFPDGQYFVELHTHTPGQVPADPSEVLAGLLVGLGVDPRFLPETLAGRSAMWRDRLAGKRVLLVLDDARDHAQIEPLLPSGEGCMTLVTSRRHMVALDGALPLVLDVLEPGPAAELFITLAGREAASVADHAAVATMVRDCGYLPLAIVLLAGRLAHHPAWTITGLAEEFTATTNRLAELDIGDRAVHAAFHLSYEDLPVERKLLFRRLGLHPGVDIDANASAALADVSVKVARRELEALYTDHLLDETGPGRYRLHDLLRLYTRTLTTADPPGDNTASLLRLLDYYQCTAAEANRWLARRPQLNADRFLSFPVGPGSGWGVREFVDEIAALAWMRLERTNLLACLQYSSDEDPLRMLALTGVTAELLERDGPWPLAQQLHQRAAETAERLGDQLAFAAALINLGSVCKYAGDHEQAVGLHKQAQAVFQERGDRLGEATALASLGVVRRETGDFGQAATLFQQALTLFHQLGDRLGEANTLGNLGSVRMQTGDHRSAADLQQQALILYRKLGNRLGEASILHNLGLLHQATREYEQAAELQQQASTLFRELGSRVGEAVSLFSLGNLHRTAGDYEQATELLQQALVIHQEQGNRLGEVGSLLGLVAVYQATGDHRPTIDLLQQAQISFRKLGHRLGEATTLGSLGDAHRAAGAYGEAAELLRQALVLHQELGHRLGEAEVLGHFGCVFQMTGDYAQATDLQRQALAIYRELGNRPGEATAMINLGDVSRSTGDCDRAADSYREALAIFREVGDRRGEACAMTKLGGSCRETGDYGQAADLHQEALAIFREIGYRLGEAETLNDIGKLLLGTGAAGDALEMFTDALLAARDIGCQIEQARALQGAAYCHAAADDTDTAVVRLREALEIYRCLGAPETESAAAYLVTLEPDLNSP